jgi:hypothetical protein
VNSLLRTRHGYHPLLHAPCEYLYFYTHSARLRAVGLICLRYQCAGLGCWAWNHAILTGTRGELGDGPQSVRPQSVRFPAVQIGRKKTTNCSQKFTFVKVSGPSVRPVCLNV